MVSPSESSKTNFLVLRIGACDVWGVGGGVRLRVECLLGATFKGSVRPEPLFGEL
ncbi:hypothetical protein [Nostoc sp. FACHB-110]|uniref:hypothetical protein n=1 Tax=Nostoc sp. FACHB-110 TaxID=2692834 RepID=UPI0016893915|nr:hypothetical protein [Nostoc sp. FACHB-110]MBD2438975.1 hypothetical protein [Nostoc sp. FACHB-110]